MERIKRFTWPSAIIIIIATFFFHYMSIGNIDRTGSRVFGEYAANDIILDLKTNGSYRIVKNYTSVMSQGRFIVRKDTIQLQDPDKPTNALLKFESEEILKVLKFDGIQPNTPFYCWLKFYPDNRVCFSGAWHQEKKHGVWQYFRPDQRRIQMTLYENGKVKDANFRFDFALPDSVYGR
jgi:hypothetical protein